MSRHLLLLRHLWILRNHLLKQALRPLLLQQVFGGRVLVSGSSAARSLAAGSDGAGLELRTGGGEEESVWTPIAEQEWDEFTWNPTAEQEGAVFTWTSATEQERDVSTWTPNKTPEGDEISGLTPHRNTQRWGIR